MLRILRIEHAVKPGQGEDSFALRSDEQGAFLCAADGCGGLGSKRYETLDGHTGAWLASRLAACCFAEWAQQAKPAPENETEAQPLCRALEEQLHRALADFANEHCTAERSRITGSMQKTLPTTLCAATEYNATLCFWWAGDSRGYVLDAAGLHQCTADDVRGEGDAFEVLYRDAPLSNLLCAEKTGTVRMKCVKADGPSAAIVVTDGVYSGLATPMEVEMLMLDTLRTSRTEKEWQKKLQAAVAANAQDDATLLLLMRNVNSFEELKTALLPRREELQKKFITPVRRRRGNHNYAKEKWLTYKAAYDWTEEGYE